MAAALWSESGLEVDLCSALSWRPGAFRGRSAGVCGAGVGPRRTEGPLCSGFGRRISGCRRATQKRVLGPVPSMGADALGAAFACGDWRAHRKVPSQTPEYTSSVGYGPEARGRRNGRWSPDGRPKRLRAGEQAAAAAAVTQPLLPCALFWETAATPGLYSGPCVTGFSVTSRVTPASRQAAFIAE